MKLGGSIKGTLEFKLKKEKNDIKVSGGLKLDLEASVNLYITLRTQSLELKLDYSEKITVSLSAPIKEKEIPLAKIPLSPVPGVNVNVIPKFVLEAEVSVAVEGTLSGSVGFSISNKEGFKNLTKDPSFDAGIEVEGKIFLGIAIELDLNLISKKLADGSITGKIGAEITAKNDKKGNEADGKDSIHTCSLCLDGDIKAKGSLSLEASILKIKALTYKTTLTISSPKVDFYFSFDEGKLGWGECPHLTYRTVIAVVDENGAPVRDASVKENAGTKETVTDEEGNAVFYLTGGKHAFTVEKGELTGKASVTIKNKKKNIKVVLGKKESDDPDNPPEIIDGKRVTQVSLGPGHSAAITEDGALYTWGYNDYGQLGDGTTEEKHMPIKIMENVQSVSLGQWNSAAITKDGVLYTWGDYYCGILGDGTTENKLIPTKITIPAEETKSTFAPALNSASVSEFAHTFQLPAARQTEAGTSEGTLKAASLTETFSALRPNERYNFYVMKSRSAEAPLSAANLLYIAQGESDAEGNLTISYQPKETLEGAEIFIVGENDFLIEDAKIEIEQLFYTGEEQFVSLKVTYDGVLLKEGVDYELSGDSSATEIGDYTVIVKGIGKYTGSREVTYTVKEGGSDKGDIKLGDVDGNGKITAGDALAILKHVVGAELIAQN